MKLPLHKPCSRSEVRKNAQRSAKRLADLVDDEGRLVERRKEARGLWAVGAREQWQVVVNGEEISRTLLLWWGNRGWIAKTWDNRPMMRAMHRLTTEGWEVVREARGEG